MISYMVALYSVFGTMNLPEDKFERKKARFDRTHDDDLHLRSRQVKDALCEKKILKSPTTDETGADESNQPLSIILSVLKKIG